MTLIHVFLSPSTNHDIYISPDHLYPSEQLNRWNNTDIGWNDTVFFFFLNIVITCIPLDRWNDTDIGWNDTVFFIVITRIPLDRWNDTDIGWDDTEIGWNDTVFFIVITCIPLDRWNDIYIVIPSVEGDTCDSDEENSVILPNSNISVISPNISVILPNISVVLPNISVIPPNISVIPSVEGDTCYNINNEENCHPSQSQCYSICREAYISDYSLQVMSI